MSVWFSTVEAKDSPHLKFMLIIPPLKLDYIQSQQSKSYPSMINIFSSDQQNGLLSSSPHPNNSIVLHGKNNKISYEVRGEKSGRAAGVVLVGKNTQASLKSLYLGPYIGNINVASNFKDWINFPKTYISSWNLHIISLSKISPVLTYQNNKLPSYSPITFRRKHNICSGECNP